MSTVSGSTQQLAAALLAVAFAAAPIAVRFDGAAPFLLKTSAAVAKDGGGDHSGSGGSGSGGSGSGGSGSSGSGGSGSGGSDSGSGSSSGSGSDGGSSGGPDDGSRSAERSGRGGEAAHIGPNGERVRIRGRGVEIDYPDGWREEMVDGALRIWDPRGRKVIERPATRKDHERISALTR
jgi:hypothetical protein